MPRGAVCSGGTPEVPALGRGGARPSCARREPSGGTFRRPRPPLPRHSLAPFLTRAWPFYAAGRNPSPATALSQQPGPMARLVPAKAIEGMRLLGVRAFCSLVPIQSQLESPARPGWRLRVRLAGSRFGSPDELEGERVHQ